MGRELSSTYQNRNHQQFDDNLPRTHRIFAFNFSSNVPTHVVTLTQVGTSAYLGQTHLGAPLQVPAWVRKFSLGSTGDEISSLIIIIRGLFVQQKFEY